MYIRYKLVIYDIAGWKQSNHILAPSKLKFTELVRNTYNFKIIFKPVYKWC